jgi:putative ABC transport system substrate-binding protein
MNNRRKLIVALGASALAAPLAAFAQQSAKIYRVGVLSTLRISNSPNDRAFTQGMEKLGWIDGQNIVIERRYSNGSLDDLPPLAADLINQKVDVIVTFSTPATQAAKQVAGTIPIVFATVSNPVGMGFVTSLARPGGNITGITSIGTEIIAKRLQLFKETIPKISRIAVVTAGEPTETVNLPELRRASKALQIDVLSIRVQSSGDLAQALELLRKWHADSIYVLDSGTNFLNRGLLANFAMKNKLPMIAGPMAHTEAGGLISYGSNYEDLSRRAASQVDKILKGVKPADIPVEQPTKFDLAINLKTAKSLGVKIPQSIMVQATKVIE